MKKVVHKYPLTASVCPIQLPIGAEILAVKSQNNTPTIWALVDPGIETIEHTFEVVPTGVEFEAEGKKYLDTVLTHKGKYVWHIFKQN